MDLITLADLTGFRPTGRWTGCLCGQHTTPPPSPHYRRHLSPGAGLCQGGMVQPRRFGKRPPCAEHPSPAPWRSGDLSGGRRLLDSTSGNMGIAYATFGACPRRPGHPRPAGQRQLGADQDPARPRRRVDPHRPARRLRWRHPGRPRARPESNPIAISTPTSTTTRRTGRPTTPPPAQRSSSRPAAR